MAHMGMKVLLLVEEKPPSLWKDELGLHPAGALAAFRPWQCEV
jgi:hypothetical protein